MIMYSVEKINEAIETLLERFKDGDDYVIFKTICFESDEIDEDEEVEIELDIEEEVSTLLDAIGVKHSIELVEAFENPGITCYVLCIAYWAENEVQSYNVPVYNC